MSKGSMEELFGSLMGGMGHGSGPDKVDTLRDYSKLKSFMRDYHNNPCDFVPGDLVVWKDERFTNTTTPALHQPVMVIETFALERQPTDGGPYSCESWDFRFVDEYDNEAGYVMFPGCSKRFRKYDPVVDGPFEED